MSENRIEIRPYDYMEHFMSKAALMVSMDSCLPTSATHSPCEVIESPKQRILLTSTTSTIVIVNIRMGVIVYTNLFMTSLVNFCSHIVFQLIVNYLLSYSFLFLNGYQISSISSNISHHFAKSGNPESILVFCKIF